MTATLDARQLARLRELVACAHCGAVPTEVRDGDGRVMTRELTNGAGGTVVLPYVVTPHAESCPGATKIGRPAKREPKWRQVDAGNCRNCDAPMLASYAHAAYKKYCDVSCRKAYAKRAVSS